jgi:hypothetical protein
MEQGCFVFALVFQQNLLQHNFEIHGEEANIQSFTYSRSNEGI